VRSALIIPLLLVGCVPWKKPEPERWIDLDDLIAGRVPAEALPFELPWPVAEAESQRSEPGVRTETVHGCLLLPLSGPDARTGAESLKSAALALEEHRETSAPRRNVQWHVIDTGSQPHIAVDGADRCLRSGATLLVGPLMERALSGVLPVVFEREAALLVPEAGASDTSFWNDRFVAIAPPARQKGRVLAAHAVSTLANLAAVAMTTDQPHDLAIRDAWEEEIRAAGGSPRPAVVPADLDPPTWVVALQEAVRGGANAILTTAGPGIVGGLLDELDQPGLEAVHLWVLAGAIEDGNLEQAARNGALDRLHFLVRAVPDRDFLRRFARRWGRAPNPAAGPASIYDAVLRGYDAAESSESLRPADLGRAARAALGPSAWGDASRSEPGPQGFVAAAGFRIAHAERNSEKGGSWAFVIDARDLGAGRSQPL
jgi:ABC-type branched-subunit amino acid transport system substrate-binding protein